MRYDTSKNSTKDVAFELKAAFRLNSCFQAIPNYSLNICAVHANLLVSIDKNFTVVFSAKQVCIWLAFDRCILKISAIR